MSKNICYVQDCEKPIRCKGLCRLHYNRMLRNGTTDYVGQRVTPAIERVLARSHAEGECVRWDGYHGDDGYGQIKDGGRMVGVHRVSWAAVNGPIPDGREIDHVCHVRDCVNVDHLRLATRLENTRNRAGANRNSGTGHRGIHRWIGGQYRVRVADSNNKRHGSIHKTIETAIVERDRLLEELFGEFAGAA